MGRPLPDSDHDRPPIFHGDAILKSSTLANGHGKDHRGYASLLSAALTLIPTRNKPTVVGRQTLYGHYGLLLCQLTYLLLPCLSNGDMEGHDRQRVQKGRGRGAVDGIGGVAHSVVGSS